MEFDNKSLLYGLRQIHLAQEISVRKVAKASTCSLADRVVKDLVTLGMVEWNYHAKGWQLSPEGIRSLRSLGGPWSNVDQRKHWKPVSQRKRRNGYKK